MEAVEGTSKDVTIDVTQVCDTCEGSGAKAGSSPKTCGTCGGQGADAAHIRYSLLVLTLGFLIVRSSHDAARAFPDAEHMPGVPRCRPSHR
jgi:hypothetical protein